MVAANQEIWWISSDLTTKCLIYKCLLITFWVPGIVLAVEIQNTLYLVQLNNTG